VFKSNYYTIDKKKVPVRRLFDIVDGTSITSVTYPFNHITPRKGG